MLHRLPELLGLIVTRALANYPSSLVRGRGTPHETRFCPGRVIVTVLFPVLIIRTIIHLNQGCATFLLRGPHWRIWSSLRQIWIFVSSSV